MNNNTNQILSTNPISNTNQISNLNNISSVNSNIYDPNSYPIIVLCLARSFDKSSVIDGSMHLVCSAYQLSLGANIDSELLGRNLGNYYKGNLNYLTSIKTESRRLILFRIQAAIDPSIYSYNSREEDFKKDLLSKYKEINEYLLEITVPIELLFSEWEVLGLDSYLNLIFGDKNLIKDDFNDSLNQTLFVFEGFQTYYAIKEFFKCHKILISGGGISSRFAVSSVHLNLASFLFLSGNYPLFENKAIFKSFHNLSASKSRSSLESKSSNLASNIISIPNSTYFQIEKFYIDLFHKYRLYKYLKLQTSELTRQIEENKQLINGLTNIIENLTKEIKTLKAGIISNPEFKKSSRSQTISSLESSLINTINTNNSTEIKIVELTKKSYKYNEGLAILNDHLYNKVVLSADQFWELYNNFKVLDPKFDNSLFKHNKISEAIRNHKDRCKTNILKQKSSSASSTNYNKKNYSTSAKQYCSLGKVNFLLPLVQYWGKSSNIYINLNKCLFTTSNFNKSNSYIKKYSTLSFDELSDSLNLINKIKDYKKNNSNQYVNKENNIRKFHTSACQLKPNNLSKINAPLPLSTFPSTNSSLSNNTSNKIGEYLDSIKQLINETINSDEIQKRETQQKLENNWIQLIEDKLNDEKFLINNYQNLLLNNIKKAKETLEIMAENNYLKKKFPKLSNELNKIDFLVLTFSLCISLYSWSSYNNIAVRLGKEILYLNYKLKYNNKKLSFDEYKENLSVNNEFYLKLGDFFMSFLQQFPHDIFVRKIKIASYFSNEPYSLEVNKEYLEEIKNNLVINPNTLPMICKPNTWTNTKYGGYLFNEEKCDDIITTNNEFAHIVKNKESLYKTVNYLNSIKFSINTRLLNYLLSTEGSYILNEIKPEDELQRSITLNMAELYKNSYFYLNTQADWRGRVYTQSFYLSYQAGDLSSALLNFWEGQTITNEGKVYLYIYGANNHNENKISKASYSDRLRWVKQNYDKIINLDKDFILSAENPFIFTAFCLNMRDIHNDPNTIIKTPVFLDATCSGIQHLAALMKDLELGVQTNLVESTYDNKPDDFYTILLDPINKAINEVGFKNPEYIDLSQVKLTRKEVKTSIMTKVYNVTTYGISQQLQSKFKTIFNKNSDENNIDEVKNSKSFDNNFHKKPIEKIEKDLLVSLKNDKSITKFSCPGINDNVTLTKKDIYKIAEIINNQIFVVFPSLNNIYNYFIDISKLTIKLGIPLTWITPSGLEITQHYLKRKKKIISVSIFGKSKKLVLRENDSEMDEAKQIQAIIPNIIHSLDATHLNNLINLASIQGFYPVITIHDCFGTLPNKMGELDLMVKKEFILLYSDNKFLNDFQNRFIQSITDNQFKIKYINDKGYVILSPTELIEIPTIPMLGQLDIENIINSKYMIS